jgi:hypothetical protein
MAIITERQAEQLYGPILYTILSITGLCLLTACIVVPFIGKKAFSLPTRINLMFCLYVTLCPILIILRLLWLLAFQNVYWIRLLGNIMVFCITFFQVEMMLEVLKLFVVLSSFLTREMIQYSQYVIAFLHPLFNGGLLLLGNAFESSIDNTPAAIVELFYVVVSIWL